MMLGLIGRDCIVLFVKYKERVMLICLLIQRGKLMLQKLVSQDFLLLLLRGMVLVVGKEEEEEEVEVGEKGKEKGEGMRLLNLGDWNRLEEIVL